MYLPDPCKSEISERGHSSWASRYLCQHWKQFEEWMRLLVKKKTKTTKTQQVNSWIYNLQSKVPHGELLDKKTELKFKMIVHYMGNPRLLLALMLLLSPVIYHISDPKSQYLVNPWDLQVKGVADKRSIEWFQFSVTT